MRLAEDGKLILSSGRECYTNRHILGLRPNDDTVYEGYDGELSWGKSIVDGVVLPDDLTVAERAEIADHVIALWQRWRAGV